MIAQQEHVDDADHIIIVKHDDVNDDDHIISVKYDDVISLPSRPSSPSGKITEITQK